MVLRPIFRSWPTPLFSEALWSHTDTPHSAELLWAGDHPDQRPQPGNTQHSLNTGIHAHGGIRTRDPRKRAAADPHLRPCGHWDRQLHIFSGLFTYLLSHSVEQSHSWEAERFSASQEIPSILWKPKVHYRIHTCVPPVPILSQLDPVHALASQFLKIHINIIFPSTPGSTNWSFSPQVSVPKPCIFLFSPHTCYMPLLISFFFIWSPEQYWARSTDH